MARWSVWISLWTVFVSGVSSLSVQRMSRHLNQQNSVGRGFQPFRAEGASREDFILEWNEAACKLALPLSTDSNALFSGRVTAPDADRLIQKKPERSVRMRGSLELSYPEQCPQNMNEFTALLKRAKFSGDLETGNVQFDTIVADSERNDLEVTLESLKIKLETSAPLRLHNNQFGVAFQVSILAGTVSANNQTSVHSMDLRGSAVGAGSGRIEEEEDKILLSIPDLSFSFSLSPRGNDSFPVRLELRFTANMFTEVDFTPNIVSSPVNDSRAEPLRTVVERDPPQNKNITEEMPFVTRTGPQNVEDLKDPQNVQSPRDSQNDQRLDNRQTAENHTGSRNAVLSQNPSTEDEVRIYVLEVDVQKSELSLAAALLSTPTILLFFILVILIVYMCTQWSKYYTYFTHDINQTEESGSEESEYEEEEDKTDPAGGEFENDGSNFEELEVPLSKEPARRITYEDIFCAIRLNPFKSKIKQWKQSKRQIPLDEKKNGWETINKLACFEHEGHEYKTRLHVANGTLPSGELTAVLGPPDSGKGLFVRLLAGDVSQLSKTDILKGSVSLHDKSKTKKRHMGMNGALARDHGTHSDVLTVSEVLGIWVAMKGPWGRHISNKKIRSSLNNAAQLMGLWEKNHVRVSSLSLLEQRKLMIACEVAKLPIAIFLDDPLHGLDAHDTLELMSRLRCIAQEEKIVALTMNQASPDQFDLIDHLLIMSHGHLLYEGPTSHINAFLYHVGFPCNPRTPLPKHILSAISDPLILHRLICLVRNAYETREADALMSILSTKDFDNTCALESSPFSVEDTLSTIERIDLQSLGRSESRTDDKSGRNVSDKGSLPRSVRSLRQFWRSISNGEPLWGSHQISLPTPQVAEDRRRRDAPSPWKQVVLCRQTTEEDPPFAEETWTYSGHCSNHVGSSAFHVRSMSSVKTYIGPQKPTNVENRTLDSVPSLKRSSMDEQNDSLFETTDTERTKTVSIELSQDARARSVTLNPRLPLAREPTFSQNMFHQESSQPTESEKLEVVVATPNGTDECSVLVQEQENSFDLESTQEIVSELHLSIEQSPYQSPTPFGFAEVQNSQTNNTQPHRAISDGGNEGNNHLEEQSSNVVIAEENCGAPIGVREMLLTVSGKMYAGVRTALLALGFVRSTRSLQLPVKTEVDQSAIDQPRPIVEEADEDTEKTLKTHQSKPIVCDDLLYDNALKKHFPRSEWSSEIAVLLLHNVTGIFRKRTGILLHYAVTIVCGLLLSLLFLDLNEDINGMQSRTSAVFFTLSILTVASILPIRQMTIQRSVILEDIKSDGYQPSSFVITQVLPDLLLLKFCPVCLFALTFLFISNFSLGFDRVCIFIFGLTIFWTTLHYTFMAVVLLVPSRGWVYLITMVIALYGLLFCGYLIPKQDLYGVVRSFTTISPMCNAFEMIVLSQLSAYEISTTLTTSEIDEFEDSLGHASHESMGLQASRFVVDSVVLMALFFTMVILVYGVAKWNLSQRHPGAIAASKAKRKHSLLSSAMRSSRTLLMGHEAH
eukprot:g2458.t1